MALILKNIYEVTYNILFPEYEPNFDYPLLTPMTTIGTMILYLYFVLKKGPELMKDREPFKLERLLMVYNGFQIISNFFYAIMITYYGFIGFDFDLRCMIFVNDGSYESKTQILYAYLYYLLKILDLMDTVFIILRKKFNQLSFLHIYHHATMVLILGLATRNYPGGHGFYYGLFNSYVHFIMYSYYFITSQYNFKSEIIFKLKKWITKIQITQFIAIGIAMSLPFFREKCTYNKLVLTIVILQDVVMIILFTNFYIKTYCKNVNNNVNSKCKKEINGDSVTCDKTK